MTERAREVTFSGFDEFAKMTRDIAPRQARNIARSTVHGVAGEVKKRMRRAAPKDQGDLRRSIVAKRRRMRGNVAISDVRIEHGKGSRYDAWYWHFVEFGTQQKSEQPYIRPTVSEMEPELPGIFRDQFFKKLQKTLDRIAKAQGAK